MQSLLKTLKAYVNPFHGAVRNMATEVEVPMSIINGLLSSREKGEEYLKEGFINQSIGEVFKSSQKRKNQEKASLFVSEYPDNKEAFSYPVANYPLAFSTAQGTLYKPHTKYLFRSYLIDSFAALVEILSELNPVVICDATFVILSFPSEPEWEDLFKILIKSQKLKESTEIILVLDNYTDELEQSLKEQERSERVESPAP